MDINPATLGFNGPADDCSPCDDGSPPRTPHLFWAFLAYVLAWAQDAARDILGGRLPSLPYFSRPMPVIASITGGADFTLAAEMRGVVRGGPQVFGGAAYRHGHKCVQLRYLPATVIVVTPGFAEVTSRSGATHLVQDGWVARRRAEMTRAASLSFGRPRTRTVKA